MRNRICEHLEPLMRISTTAIDPVTLREVHGIELIKRWRGRKDRRPSRKADASLLRPNCWCNQHDRNLTDNIFRQCLYRWIATKGTSLFLTSDTEESLFESTSDRMKELGMITLRSVGTYTMYYIPWILVQPSTTLQNSRGLWTSPEGPLDSIRVMQNAGATFVILISGKTGTFFKTPVLERLVWESVVEFLFMVKCVG